MQSVLKSVCLLYGCCAGVAGAGQPISESMVECGALYTVAALWVAEPGNVQRLEHAASVWEQAAHRQAEAEGRAGSQSYVPDLWLAKCDAWSDKGAAYFLTQDFRDWTEYCRALARSRGLDMKAD